MHGRNEAIPFRWLKHNLSEIYIRHWSEKKIDPLGYRPKYVTRKRKERERPRRIPIPIPITLNTIDFLLQVDFHNITFSVITSIDCMYFQYLICRPAVAAVGQIKHSTMTMIKIRLANKLHECLSMYPFTTTRRNFQSLFGTFFSVRAIHPCISGLTKRQVPEQKTFLSPTLVYDNTSDCIKLKMQDNGEYAVDVVDFYIGVRVRHCGCVYSRD